MNKYEKQCFEKCFKFREGYDVDGFLLKVYELKFPKHIIIKYLMDDSMFGLNRKNAEKSMKNFLIKPRIIKYEWEKCTKCHQTLPNTCKTIYDNTPLKPWRKYEQKCFNFKKGVKV